MNKEHKYIPFFAIINSYVQRAQICALRNFYVQRAKQFALFLYQETSIYLFYSFVQRAQKSESPMYKEQTNVPLLAFINSNVQRAQNVPNACIPKLQCTKRTNMCFLLLYSNTPMNKKHNYVPFILTHKSL